MYDFSLLRPDLVSSSINSCEKINPFVKFKFSNIFFGYTIILSSMFVNLTNAKSIVIFASGPMFLSTLECEISLSCHKAIFSKAGTTALLTILASPVKFSLKIGFFLCGIAEEPF